MNLAKKTFIYFLIFTAPLAIIICGEILVKYTFPSLESDFLKTAFYGGLGVILFAAIYLLNAYAIQLLKLKPVFWGNGVSLLWGLGIGVLVSLVSGVGVGILNGYSLHLSKLFLNFDIKVIGNLYPALTEEVYFRGGVVHVVAQALGQTFGLASGSIPFGVIHIVGAFFGKTVSIAQIVGISLAGLMLSLMYLRFGLLGAISSHLMWNTFVAGWQKVYAVEDENIVSYIEGSWITCCILVVVCVFLYWSRPKKDLSQVF